MDIFLEIDDDLDENEKLWRYMDLAKFISMLSSKTMWLARADTFCDSHEGRFPDEMRQYIEEAYKNFKNVSDLVKDADDFQRYLVKNTYISCWHKNVDENMVMWEIYGRESNSIAVQTTVGRIKECIDTSNINGHSLILGNVKYQNSNEELGILPYERCFFRKRPHFSFEQEVRLSLDTYSVGKPSKDTPLGVELNISLLDLIFIENVIVHPDSQEWFYRAVKSVIEQYKLHTNLARGVYGNN